MIVCFTLLNNITYSQSQENGTQVFYFDASFSELHNQTPAYKLVTIVDKPSIDPGQSVNVNIYITGMGRIEKNKISVYVPPRLLNEKNPGIIGGTIGCKTTQEKEVKDIRGIPPNLIHCLNDTCPVFSDYHQPFTSSGGFFNARLILRNCNFMAEPTIGENDAAPVIMAETEHGRGNETERKPPIYMVLNTAKNASPGDHKIEIVLTYSDGSGWYQDTKEILIHITNPIEQNRYLVTILIAFLGLIISWKKISPLHQINEWVSKKYFPRYPKLFLIIRYFLQLLITCFIIYIIYLVFMSV